MGGASPGHVGLGAEPAMRSKCPCRAGASVPAGQDPASAPAPGSCPDSVTDSCHEVSSQQQKPSDRVLSSHRPSLPCRGPGSDARPPHGALGSRDPTLLTFASTGWAWRQCTATHAGETPTHTETKPKHQGTYLPGDRHDNGLALSLMKLEKSSKET